MPSADGSLPSTLGLVFTSAMGLLLLLLPRRWALVPVIILTCFMTMGQAIVVGGMHFTMLRILTLFGCARIVLRAEYRWIRMTRVDKLILWWLAASVITHTFLWLTLQEFINRLGLAYDAIGLYFLFRSLLRNSREIASFVRIFAILMVPLAAFMVLEKGTGRNLFATFGGVLEFTRVRDGALRCQGPFGHPILAGTFGATSLPLFAVLWCDRAKILSVLGMGSAMALIGASASSTPIFAALACVVSLGMWRLHGQMRAVRWGMLLLLVMLQLNMRTPIWFLPAKIGAVAGSDSYHRAYIVDEAVAHLGDWWFLGTKDNAQWGFLTVDVTNEYLRVGYDGGFLPLLLFIALISQCFCDIGRSLRRAQFRSFAQRFWIWGLGCALLTHVVGFWSVSYWDQNIVSWYMVLAMIASTTQFVLQASVSRDTAVIQEQVESSESIAQPA